MGKKRARLTQVDTRYVAHGYVVTLRREEALELRRIWEAWGSEDVTIQRLLRSIVLRYIQENPRDDTLE